MTEFILELMPIPDGSSRGNTWDKIIITPSRISFGKNKKLIETLDFNRIENFGIAKTNNPEDTSIFLIPNVSAKLRASYPVKRTKTKIGAEQTDDDDEVVEEIEDDAEDFELGEYYINCAKWLTQNKIQKGPVGWEIIEQKWDGKLTEMVRVFTEVVPSSEDEADTLVVTPPAPAHAAGKDVPPSKSIRKTAAVTGKSTSKSSAANNTKDMKKNQKTK